MRFASLATLTLLAACRPARQPGAVVADPAVLRGALRDWQEGPTDGRVCLDPRVLAAAGDTVPPRRWAESVLAALLTDTLVALDTSAAPRGNPTQRACASSPQRPRIALGMPVVRGDSAVMVTAAFPGDRGAAPASELRLPVILGRRGSSWYIRRRPGQKFIPLPPAG